MTSDAPPSGPLARLRAQLAGPRGYRRIDALLSAEDAQAAAEFEAMPAEEIGDGEDLTAPSEDSDGDANVEGRAGDVDIDAEVPEPESQPPG